MSAVCRNPVCGCDHPSLSWVDIYCCQDCRRSHKAALWDAEQSAMSAYRDPLAAPPADEQPLPGVPVSPEPAETKPDPVSVPLIVHPAGAIPAGVEASVAEQIENRDVATAIAEIAAGSGVELTEWQKSLVVWAYEEPAPKAGWLPRTIRRLFG